MTPLIRFPRAELSGLIKELTEAVCLWDDEPVPFLGQIGGKPGYYTTLSVTRTKQLGNVEERLTTDEVRMVNTVVEVTYYRYSIAVHVVSFDKQLPSFDIASQIRRGLRSQPGHDEMAQNNLVYVNFGDTLDRQVEHDNRTASESTFELNLMYFVSVDPGGNKGQIITSVGSLNNKITE